MSQVIYPARTPSLRDEPRTEKRRGLGGAAENRDARRGVEGDAAAPHRRDHGQDSGRVVVARNRRAANRQRDVSTARRRIRAACRLAMTSGSLTGALDRRGRVCRRPVCGQRACGNPPAAGRRSPSVRCSARHAAATASRPPADVVLDLHRVHGRCHRQSIGDNRRHVRVFDDRSLG